MKKKFKPRNPQSFIALETENSRNKYFFHSAFTLVELLVTVSVIAIIVSMLLPALNSARGKAQTIFCANNAKTCGLAVMNYCNSNDSYIPLAKQNPLPGNKTSSWGWLLLLTEDLNSGKELTCPGLLAANGYCVRETYVLTQKKVQENTEPVPWRADYGGFGFNNCVKTGLYPQARIGGFRNPSQKFMLADNRTLAINSLPTAYTHIYIEFNKTQPFFFGWHSYTANTAFFDGHVEGIRGKTTDPEIFAKSIYNQPRFKWKSVDAATLYSVAITSIWLLK